MRITHLSLINFRNYRQLQVDFSDGINCLAGHNGAGKTNLIDAIHYLSFCKSYFNSFDNQNIYHDEDMFIIQGLFEKDGSKEEIYCAQKKNERKQFKRNKKDYARLSEHIGLLPVVMITPLDVVLVYEGSDARRKFTDSIISQVDSAYLNDLIDYNKALLNRNAMLKQFQDTRNWDDTLVAVWNEVMIVKGKSIHRKRKQFTEVFSPMFLQAYSEISGSKEFAHIEYSSKLSGEDFGALLTQALPKDKALAYTTTGIHKDDWLFGMEDKSLKKFASQGQQKSFIIALKMAQFRYLKKFYTASPPIIMLDDIFDKLDESRVGSLIEMVCSDEFGQVFITDTNAERMEKLLENTGRDYRIFHVEEGKLRVENEKLKMEIGTPAVSNF